MLQNQKLDSHIAGEPILANGKYSAHLLDAGNVPFKKGKIMWSEGRFSHVPGRMSAADYETMCKKLNETSQWQLSRPDSKFEPGFAEYTTRPIDWERQKVMIAPTVAENVIERTFGPDRHVHGMRDVPALNHGFYGVQVSFPPTSCVWILSARFSVGFDPGCSGSSHEQCMQVYQLKHAEMPLPSS